MAKGKIEVLMEVSEVNLRRAEKRFDTSEYDSAAFHASTAVESAANALILKLGGDEAKNHRALSALATVIRRRKPQWLTQEDCAQIINKGKEIQREVIYTHYPHKVAGVWVTPMKYYTQEKARKMISNARLAVDRIKEYLKRTTTQSTNAKLLKWYMMQTQLSVFRAFGHDMEGHGAPSPLLTPITLRGSLWFSGIPQLSSAPLQYP